MKKKLYLQLVLLCLSLLASPNVIYAQCPASCTFTEANGPNINFSGNQTLCITANTGDLNINFNGSNNVICVAPGVTWTQTNGLNLSGVTINVYGNWVMNGGINANAASTINIYSGATFTTASTGFGNNLTINNAGTTTFTATGQISNAGNFVFNNTAGATLTATATSLFKVGNGNSFDNYGTMTFSNLENEEANLFYNRSSGFISIGRYFYNHGAFYNEGEVETICGSFGTVACEFIVGDKGPGKAFVNSACFSVTGNVRFDGPATNNADFEIINGDLTINKPVTGTNGRFIVTNGVSTINLAGSYAGTNLRICDQNTAGNGFDVINNSPSSNLYTVDCSANTCAAAPPACTISGITTNATLCMGANSNAYDLSGQIIFSNAPTTGSLIISVEGGQSKVYAAPFTSPLNYNIQKLVADGVSHAVTAYFTASPNCTFSTSVSAPSPQGTGFYTFPLNSPVSSMTWGSSPYPQQSWDNFYVPGYGGPFSVGGGIHDLDLLPQGVTNLAAVCGELAEGVGGGAYLNKYVYRALEFLSRGRAGEAGIEASNIPAGGIGKVRAGMIRYLYDQYYTSTDANAWTAENGAAFQLALWEIVHEVYTSNNSFSITTASPNGFYVQATYNTASRDLAQSYLNAINALNWTDQQWMSYQPTNWHVMVLESNDDTSVGGEDSQDLVVAQPIVCAIVACNLTDAGETNETCNNNGTTSATDDYISFSLNPTGTGLGASYSVSTSAGTLIRVGGGSLSGIPYGSPVAFRLQDGSANSTTFTITITDVSGAPCTIMTTVQQSPCSSCPYIPCASTTIMKNNN